MLGRKNQSRISAIIEANPIGFYTTGIPDRLATPDGRNPAPAEVGSSFHLPNVFYYTPQNDAGFLTSTVWTGYDKVVQILKATSC